jgi:flavin-binding protein dodecin
VPDPCGATGTVAEVVRGSVARELGTDAARRPRGDNVSEHVYRVTEIVGTSTSSTDDAIRNAIARANETLRNLDWFEVTEMRGHLVDGAIGHFQVTIKVGFRLDDD